MNLFDLLTFFGVFIIFSLASTLMAILSYRLLPYLTRINAMPEPSLEVLEQAAPDVIRTLFLISLVFILAVLLGIAIFSIFNYMAWLSLKKENQAKKWFWKYYLVNLLLIIIGGGICFITVLLIQTPFVSWLILLELLLLYLFSFLARAFFKDKVKESFSRAWAEFKKGEKYFMPILMIILVMLILLSVLSMLVKISNVIFGIINLIIFILFIGWSRRYLFLILKNYKKEVKVKDEAKTKIL